MYRQLAYRALLEVIDAAWPTGTAGADCVLATVQTPVEALRERYERAQQSLSGRRSHDAASSPTTCCTDVAIWDSGGAGRAVRAEAFPHSRRRRRPAPYTEGEVVPRLVERAVNVRFGDRNTMLTIKEPSPTSR